MAAVDPQQLFSIFNSGARYPPFQIASLIFTPHGGQRYCAAKHQELGAALVAFISIGKCDDRARAVMSDEAKDVRTNCR